VCDHKQSHQLPANRIDRARDLRKRMPDAEQKVWRELRSRRFAGYKFRRQHPLGSYFVDFVCLSSGVVVELDGGQHNTEEARSYDARRTRWLEGAGYRVLRFWNHEVLEDWESVAEAIWRAVSAGDLRDSRERSAE
jgi:very-short-patch-repair endonuclease